MSSNQWAGFPVNAGVWCTSMPTTWSPRTNPSPNVWNHTLVKPIADALRPTDLELACRRT
jgi:hypothetical protein